MFNFTAFKYNTPKPSTFVIGGNKITVSRLKNPICYRIIQWFANNYTKSDHPQHLSILFFHSRYSKDFPNCFNSNPKNYAKSIIRYFKKLDKIFEFLKYNPYFKVNTNVGMNRYGEQIGSYELDMACLYKEMEMNIYDDLKVINSNAEWYDLVSDGNIETHIFNLNPDIDENGYAFIPLDINGMFSVTCKL
jgi:hypothetical protein